MENVHTNIKTAAAAMISFAVFERVGINLSGAKKADIHVGVYFFSQAVTVEEAVEEAKYVIRHIRGRGVTYPVVFDMEPISGPIDFFLIIGNIYPRHRFEVVVFIGKSSLFF